MFTRTCFISILLMGMNAYGKTVCDSIACVDDAGKVTFTSGFRGDMQELGAQVKDGRVGSGGAIGGNSSGGGQDNNSNNNISDNNADSSNGNNNNGNSTEGAQANNQAASNGDLGGGNNGFGAGGQAAGFNNNGSSDLIGDSADTFEGFNNFDGSEDGGEKKSTLEVSPVLGKAINEQGSKRGIASDNSADGGGRGLQDSDSPQLAAAYNGGGGGRGYAGSSAKGQAYGKDSSGKEGGNSIVSQAANFVKGAFGIGGSKNGRRRGSGKNYGSVGKSKSMRLAMNKTKSPEQVLKEKWARMRRAGYVGRRGVASTAPRGMLDVRVNIFHGMCKEYSVFASEIGSKDSGYCPPAR